MRGRVQRRASLHLAPSQHLPNLTNIHDVEGQPVEEGVAHQLGKQQAKGELHHALGGEKTSGEIFFPPIFCHQGMEQGTHRDPECPEEADGFRLLRWLFGALQVLSAAVARGTQWSIIRGHPFRVLLLRHHLKASRCSSGHCTGLKP